MANKNKKGPTIERGSFLYAISIFVIVQTLSLDKIL